MKKGNPQEEKKKKVLYPVRSNEKFKQLIAHFPGGGMKRKYTFWGNPKKGRGRAELKYGRKRALREEGKGIQKNFQTAAGSVQGSIGSL